MIDSYSNGLPELHWQYRIKEYLVRRFDKRIYEWPIRLAEGSRVYPDICISRDGKKRDICVECKIEVGVHAMLQALGQCIFYKEHCAQVMLMVPECMRYKIPVEIDGMIELAGIWIVTERDIESAIAQVIEPQATEAAA